MPLLRLLRRGLDFTYLVAGIIAALSLIAILSLIVLQMLARWTGEVFPGAPDYAGYAMASASFFALAYALNHGAHIRVTLMLSNMGRWRRWGEIWATGIAAVIATFFARYAIKANYWSEKLRDISQGQDATPLWIPQLSMSIGTVLLAIALWDHVIRLIFTTHAGVMEQDITERTE